MNINLLRKIGIQISEESISTCRDLGDTLLKLQKDTNRAFISGGIGFEEIINKNELLSRKIESSKDFDILISTDDIKKDGITDDEIVFKKFEELRSYINKGTAYYMFSMLTIINNVLIKAESEYKIDLSAYKPTLDDWMNINIIFAVDKFFVSKRTAVSGATIYSLNVKYKNIIVQIIESGSTLYYVHPDYVYESYMPLLNPSWFNQKLKSLVEPASTYPKKEKALERLRILNNTTSKIPLFIGEPVIFDFANLIFHYDNEEKVIAQYVGIYDSIIRNNTHLYKVLNCYSRSGDRYINGYLLQRELFGKGVDNIMDHVNNQICHEYKPSTCIKIILDSLKSPLLAQYFNSILHNMEFSTYRFTRPSVYGHRLIEQYNIGDELGFATIISTTYRVDSGMTAFTSTTPLVIFKFNLSKKQADSFIFMETASEINEFEVIIKPNTVFTIKNKSYINMCYEGDKKNIFQKLLIELDFKENKLVILDDTQAIKQYIPSNNTDIFDDMRFKNLSQPIPEQKMSIRQIPEQKMSIRQIPEQKMSNDVNFPDIITGGSNELRNGVYTFYDESKYIPIDSDISHKRYNNVVNFCYALPNYLRNDSGYKLNKPVNGYSYVDYGIFKLFPYLTDVVQVNIQENNMIYDEISKIQEDQLNKLENEYDEDKRKLIKNEYSFIADIASSPDKMNIVKSTAYNIKTLISGALTSVSSMFVPSQTMSPYRNENIVASVAGGKDNNNFVTMLSFLLCIILVILLIVLLCNIYKSQNNDEYSFTSLIDYQ